MKIALVAASLAVLPGAQVARGAELAVREGTFVARDVRFATGETLAEVKLRYRTLGAPQRDAAGVTRNAVLILHGTGGSGAQFLQPQFADELFGTGQPLDASRWFVILPDAIGHGGSSKPSDGMGMGFPRYAYDDMVGLQHRLVTEGLGVDHLRLVLGTSMGGMHTWMWGYRFPDFMDALVPLASVPTAIVGGNRVWRKMLADSIRDDPAWKGGVYAEQPRQGLRAAVRIQVLMGAAPLYWQTLAPVREKADAFAEAEVERRWKALDANDVLYQFDASRDYDPSPHLEGIKAPVLAINSADDAINPPGLGLMERLMGRVSRGTFVLVPASEATRGHSTHTWAAVWRHHLEAFLASLEGPPRAGQRGTTAAQEVESLERELLAAIGARDLARYDRLVADGYVALRASGDLSKAAVMDAYRQGTLAYRGLDIEDVATRVYGDVAVVSARTRGTRIEAGGEVPNRVRYLRVWARREGAWRAVLQMAVPLPPD